MQQLKMYWKPVPTEYPVLPESWSWRTYNGTQADAQAWADCCRSGLLGLKDGAEAFEVCICKSEGYSPDAVYFIEHDGVPVATITALLDEEKIGHAHYVGAKPEVRGMGVGGWLNQIVQADLWQRGCVKAYLTTDEFRVPAIKSYLSAGFLPVEYDVEMDQRWSRLLRSLERPNVPMVDENGDFVQTLYPCEV